MWFLDELTPGTTLWHIRQRLRIVGPLDVSALASALRELQARHETLRTRFPSRDGVVTQQLGAPEIALPVHDLRALNATERDARIAEIRGEEARPFRLEEGPPWRAQVARIADDEHLVWITVHHLISDEWSMRILCKELDALYTARVRGRPAQLEPLPIQYADYAAWQHAQAASAGRMRDLTYWREQLRDVSPLVLPADRPLPGLRSHRSGSVSFVIPAEVADRLRALCAREDATLFMGLLTAFKLLLVRYTGAHDVTIGTPVGNRFHRELRNVVGLFVNTLVVRTDLLGVTSFVDALRRVREVLLAGLEHHATPFDRVVDALRPERGTGSRLFNVLCVLYNPPATMRLDGLTVEQHWDATGYTDFDLALGAFPRADKPIDATFTYDAEQFERATIENVADQFQRLLALLVAAPERPVETLDGTLACLGRADTPVKLRGFRIVVSATYTADPIVSPLALWFDRLKLRATVELAPYNQVFQELLDPSSLTARTDAQGFNVLLLRFEDWTGISYERADGSGRSAPAALASIEANTAQLIEALTAAAGRSPASFVVCVTPMSKAARMDPLFTQRCAALEERLVTAFAKTSNVRVVPSFQTLTDPDLDPDDAEANQLGHVPYSPHYFAALGTLVARRIYGTVAPPRKVIVLDADQTLWRGVCGEDGPDGVVLDPPHLALQRFMVKRSAAGMLLCLCSKNNEEDVAEVFARRGAEMPLGLDHLVAKRINWQPKSANLRSLAEELSLGLDSMIFVDDDPAVCAEVEENCPDVLTLRIPTDETLPRFLDNVWAFDTAAATEEDAKRTQLYKQNRERARLQERSASFGDFLASLELRVTIASMRPEQLARVAQLTMRTNQFNTTTIRRSERELELGGLACTTVEVADRFGDYGLVGVMLHRVTADALVVDSMLLSCRALGRGVEHRMLAFAGALAQQRGLARVEVRFARTARNAPALEFLEGTGRAYREPGPEGDTFVYPVEVAATCTFAPGARAPDVPRDDAAKTKPGNVRVPIAPWSELARELYDPVRVMEAIAAADQAQRVPSTTRAELVAPRTPHEQTVAQIWCELLGVPHVGVHDNFFALGGHSLLAIRFTARLRREGFDLEVRTLFATPTLEAVAAALTRTGARYIPENRLRPDATTITPADLPLITFTQEDIDTIVARVPGGVANIQDIYALSPLQEGMLFHHQLATDDAYARATHLRFADRTTLDRYLAALQRVVDRHDVLRTAILWEGLSSPAQVVWRRAHILATQVSLAELEALDPRCLRFDLSRAPLFQLAIAPDPDGVRWHLVQTWHHIVMDQESFELMVAEIRAIVAGRADALPSPRPYRNLIADVRLGATNDAAHERYFRAQLAEVDEPSAPFGVLDAFGDGRDITEVTRPLPPDLDRRLRTQAQRLGVGLAALHHVAWAVVVAATSGQRRAVFGTVLFGRMHTDGAELALGLYMNTLPLALDVDGPSVEASVRVAQAALAELMRHEHAALALAQRCSAVTPPAPLFTTLLNFRHIAPRPPSADRLGIEVLAGEERTNYPLVMSVNDTGHASSLSIQAMSPLAPQRIGAMMEHVLDQLAHALEHSPAIPLRAIDVVPPTERAQLAAWNATAHDVTGAPFVVAMIEDQVDRTPDAIAITYEGTSLTYRELDARANQLAHHLVAAGARRGRPVAVCLDRSSAMVVSVLAILKTGAPYLPIDPAYPPARIRAILDDSACTLAVGDTAGRATLEGTGVTGVWLDTLSSSDASRPAVAIAGGDAAYVLFTSGSTGRPKGVVIEHAGLRNRLLWPHAFGFSSADRFVLKTPFTFDVSVFELLYPFVVGARLVIARPDGHRDPFYLAELVRDEAVTYAHFVPSMLGPFLGAARATPCPSLRRVICSGEALSAALVRDAAATLDAELYNLYGPTEASIDVTWWRCAPAEATVPIGVPAPNTRLYVLDRSGRLTPIGVAGELYLAGVQLARGYAGRPDLTAERFVPDPFHPGERMYRTGDLARWRADGAVEYLGRLDHQIKLRGLRIELGEIEAVLRSDPAVADAAVLVHAEQLVAYVVARDPDGSLAIDEVQRTLRAALPDYMVPAVFVPLDALPLTASGKLDRKALPAPTLAPSESYVAPRTEIERALAVIWIEVLGMDRVGVHDNFIALGGHSLLAIRMIARVERRFGVKIPLRDLFVDPTLGALAARVGRARASSSSVERPALFASAARRARLPAALRGVFRLNKLVASNLFARHIWSVWIDGVLEISSLERAFATMRARHALLRTRFFEDDQLEMLEVLDPADVERFALLDRADLSSLSGEDQAAADAEFHHTVCLRPLEIGRGEVMSAALSQWSATRHRLTVSLHNIVSDDETMAVYANELCDLWRDPAAPLPPVSLHYHHLADYLERLRESEVGRAQRAFWKTHLDGLQPLQLPIDSPREEVDARREANAGVVTFPSGSVVRLLPEQTMTAIERTSERERASVMSTLVAAMAAYLSRRTSQRDLAFVTRLSHRYLPGLERMLGFLVNPIVLRISTEGEPAFSELVGRTHTVVTDAFDHGECDLFEIAPYHVFRFCLVYTRAAPVVSGKLQLPDGCIATKAPHPGASAAGQIGYDLLLWLTHHDDGITLHLAYNLELFRETTATAFLEGYVEHVTAACKAP